VDTAEQLKSLILENVRRYYTLVHAPKPFVPGQSKIPYAGRVFDDDEMTRLVSSALEFWLTAGPSANKLEQTLKKLFNSREYLLVNSGSSANLVMVSTLCSQQVERRLLPGDEVLTPAVTFPSTLSPIIQNQLTPVFVDCEVGTYNINPHLVEDAIGPRTRAIFIPHTLGNPCDMQTIEAIARRHNLWLLEDCCDAFGATFDGQSCGTFGEMSSLSFYPAHHMTLGEGGGVAIKHAQLGKVAKSIRDWGRDCWCDPGIADTCGKRFNWQLGALPSGYDHKYIYSNIGYNLKLTDLQASIGLAQIEKLPSFIEARRRNFRQLYNGLKTFEQYLILPEWHPLADPSWFGFPLTVRTGVSRSRLVRWLESNQIETRQIFAGNILRQPGFQNISRRISGKLDNSDCVMNDSFFVGVYPGLSDSHIDYVIDQFHIFFTKRQ
jgi:CDP-6-deoxy-D-xylo-4-hexulose-3-dehydrase